MSISNIKRALQDTTLRIVQPNVRVLACTQIVDTELSTQLTDPDFPSYTLTKAGGLHEDGEYLIEMAGRQCYESFHNPAGRTTDEYIRNILAQRHYSVLEHTNVTFHLSGISRSLTHELIRHRHLSYSQLSQRYVDSREASFVCPPLVLADNRLLRKWLRAVETIQRELVEFQGHLELHASHIPQKQKREAIRSLAPNAIETKIVVTGNLRAWRDVLEKRWNSHADAEIQQVAGIIAAHLIDIYPSTFSDVAYT